MKGSRLLSWRDYKHRDPQNQYPCVKVDMSWRTEEMWEKVMKEARQNANKNVYDNSYVRE